MKIVSLKWNRKKWTRVPTLNSAIKRLFTATFQWPSCSQKGTQGLQFFGFFFFSWQYQQYWYCLDLNNRTTTNLKQQVHFNPVPNSVQLSTQISTADPHNRSPGASWYIQMNAVNSSYGVGKNWTRDLSLFRIAKTFFRLCTDFFQVILK